jgi:UBX domain-containing protein 1
LWLQARQFLDANNWDIEAAVTEFYAERDEALQDMNFGSGRRLGTDEDPLSSGGRSPGGSHGAHLQSTQQSQARQQKKFATLSDLSGGGATSENTDEDDDNQDFFAGGEKSGLAVQNPDDIKQKIMEKAMKYAIH